MKNIDMELILTALMNLRYPDLPKDEVAVMVRGANLYLGAQARKREKANGLRPNTYRPLLKDGAVKTNLKVNLENSRQDLGLGDTHILKDTDEAVAQMVAAIYTASFHKQAYYDQLLGKWHSEERDYFNQWTSGSTTEELGRALDDKVMETVECARSGGYVRGSETRSTEDCLLTAIMTDGARECSNFNELFRGKVSEIDVKLFDNPVKESFGFMRHHESRESLLSRQFMFGARASVSPVQEITESEVIEVSWRQAIDMYREELTEQLPLLIKGTERDVEAILTLAEKEHVPLVGWLLKKLIEESPKLPLIGTIKGEGVHYQIDNLNPVSSAVQDMLGADELLFIGSMREPLLKELMSLTGKSEEVCQTMLESPNAYVATVRDAMERVMMNPFNFFKTDE